MTKFIDNVTAITADWLNDVDAVLEQGAAAITFTQAGAGAVPRDQQARGREVMVSVKDYGAIGDGVVDDLAAFSAALAASRHVFVPPGTYKLSASLAVADSTTITGRDKLSTIILAASSSFPVLVNANTVNPRDITLRDLQLLGGNYSIDLTVSSVQSNLQCVDVQFSDAVQAAIRCNQMFILNSFTRCVFDSTTKGVVASAANANLNTFYDCEFKELANSAIEFHGGCEANTWIGCRFEARNTPATDTGKDVLVLQGGKGNKFQGCYFEDTFVNILRETGSSNTTAFDSCRFSGQENTVGGTGFKAETFISDGLVTFANNQFASVGGSNGAPNMLVVGTNAGLNTRNANTWHHADPTRLSVTTRTVAWASGIAEDLFTFSRTNTFGSANNRSTLAGTLEVTCAGRLVDGTRFFIRRRRPVLIIGTAGDVMSIVFGTEEAVEQNAAGATLVLSQKAGASATTVTIQAVAAIANLDNSEISARLDVQVVPAAGYDPLTVAAVAA